MRKAQVTVPWDHGLHARPAARLVRLTRSFRSRIRLRLGNRIADARSILNVIVLSASLGAAIEVEADGIDEQDAIRAMEDFFEQRGAPPDAGNDSAADQA